MALRVSYPPEPSNDDLYVTAIGGPAMASRHSSLSDLRAGTPQVSHDPGAIRPGPPVIVNSFEHKGLSATKPVQGQAGATWSEQNQTGDPFWTHRRQSQGDGGAA